MVRRLLPAAALLLAGGCSLPILADESSVPVSTTNSELRVEVDAKRAQITGADITGEKVPVGEQAILDAPVDTDDAPTVDE